MDDLPHAFFFTAGAAMFAHVVLCKALRWRLRDREDLLKEMFAIPNEFLGKTGRADSRLLRARYYLPWVAPDAATSQLSSLDGLLLFAARMTGLIVPMAWLMFFVASFVSVS